MNQFIFYIETERGIRYYGTLKARERNEAHVELTSWLQEREGCAEPKHFRVCDVTGLKDNEVTFDMFTEPSREPTYIPEINVPKLLTVAKTVHGPDKAQYIADILVGRSQWFTFQPLPDNKYEFIVKRENDELLEKLIEEKNRCPK